MKTIVGQGMDDIYSSIYQTIVDHGQKFGPRGKLCVELRPATIELTDPSRALYTGSSRHLNYRFFAVETLLYLSGMAGKQHAELILAANPNMKFALNHNGYFDGAYGPMLIESLGHIQTLLTKDPHTRQAVASIWSPTTGTILASNNSKDIPCTCLLHFYQEFGRLGMCVYMRSNDINWGTPYDIAAFCTIQCLMASALGIKPGKYTHIAGSLHFYEEGNSDGERPPTIVDHAHETFYPATAVCIPLNTCRDSIVFLQNLAYLFCEDLHTHIIKECGEWKDFKLTEPMSLMPFFIQFDKLMKFRHNKGMLAWKDSNNEGE